MKEQKFEVLEKTAPTRCEVCHQADRFDPYTETCMRCQALIVAQALPEQEAIRFQERQQAETFLPEAEIRSRDLFPIFRESFSICRRNLMLFVSIFSIVKIPLILFSASQSLIDKSDSTLLALMSLLITFANFILPNITTGAMLKAMLNRYRGEAATLIDSYRFVLQRGFKFLVTSVLGTFFETMGIFLCIFGILYTLPRYSLVSEVAIVEEKYYRKAARRSIELGTRNRGMLLLFHLLFGVGILAIQAPLIPIAMTLGHMWGMDWKIILGVLSIPLEFLAYPFFTTTKLLLYFYLRMRTDKLEKFVYEPKESVLPA